jgi:hypothetical protein
VRIPSVEEEDLRRSHRERSKQMLKTKIEQFITYFNATMARPFRWTYAGKPLVG